MSKLNETFAEKLKQAIKRKIDAARPCQLPAQAQLALGSPETELETEVLPNESPACDVEQP